MGRKIADLHKLVSSRKTDTTNTIAGMGFKTTSHTACLFQCLMLVYVADYGAENKAMKPMMLNYYSTDEKNKALMSKTISRHVHDRAHCRHGI